MRPRRRQTVLAAMLGVLWLSANPGCTYVDKVLPEALKKPHPEAQEAPAEKQGGETSAKVPSPAQAEPSFMIHTVSWRGETLSLIAKWYTDDPENWRALAKSNPDLNPHVIRIGDQILIPEALVKTRAPMPKDFVVPPAPGNSSLPAPAASGPEEAKKLELFGPK